MFPYRFKIYILKNVGLLSFFDYSYVGSKWLLHRSGDSHCVFTIGSGFRNLVNPSRNHGRVSTMPFHFYYLSFMIESLEMSSIMQTLNMDSDASVGVRNWVRFCMWQLFCQDPCHGHGLKNSVAVGPVLSSFTVRVSGCGGVCFHVSGSAHIPTAVNSLSGVLPVREQCMGT